MRTLLLAPQPYMEIRGTPLANYRLAGTLGDAGYEVDLFTYPFGTAPAQSGVSVHRCPPFPGIGRVGIGFSSAKLLTDLSLAVYVSRAVRGRSYDVIHAIEEGVFIALMLKNRLKCPVIYDMDSVMSHDMASSPLGRIGPAMSVVRRAEKWAVRRSDLVMTITQSMADHVRAIDPQKKVAVVPDIPQPLPPGGLNLEYARSQLPTDMIGHRKLIVYAGSSAKYQGLDLLITALGRVKVESRDVVLVVLGGEGKELEVLKQQAKAEGVMQNLLFLGKKPPEDVSHFLALADVLVSPRRSGMNPPMKIYTYMQSGSPLVATRIPAHTTVLSDDMAILTGVQPEEIAEGILRALSHPEEARHKATRAREAVSHMTPEFQANRILAAYDLLLGGSDTKRKAA